MKFKTIKKGLFCLVLCCMVTLLGYSQQPSLQIDLKLKGHTNSGKAMLISYKGNNPDTVIHQITNAGSVVLKTIATSEPNFYFLKIDGFKEVLTLFLTAGITKVSGNFSDWPKVKITGSASHKEYETYHLLTDSLENIGRKLVQEYSGLKDTAVKSVIEKKMIANIEAYEARQFEFVVANPNSYYSPVVINNAKWNWIKKRTAYSKLSENIKNSFFSLILAKNIAKWKHESGLLEVGDIVPDFNAKMPDGNVLSLRKELADNKLTLIDFWASWCSPCRLENANLLAVYKEYKDTGFDIIGVSLDGKDADWKQAIAKDRLSWEQVCDLKGWESPLVKVYFSGMSFNFIPQNFLVDAKGRILARNLRGEKLKEKVSELFNGGTL